MSKEKSSIMFSIFNPRLLLRSTFESSGFYDSCQYGLGWSQAIGGLTRDTALFLGGAAAWRAVLDGGPMALKASIGLLGAGFTPIGVIATQMTAGSQLSVSLSLTSTFFITQGLRLSTIQNVIDQLQE